MEAVPALAERFGEATLRAGEKHPATRSVHSKIAECKGVNQFGGGAHVVRESAGYERKTVVLCGFTANVGESSDYSLGSIIFVGW